MARLRSGGRISISTTPPPLFSQEKKNSTQTKYFGLVRDLALSDIESADKALDEILKDIQDPAELSTLGQFVSADLQIIDAITSFNLKKEDFEILKGASISASVIEEAEEDQEEEEILEEDEAPIFIPFVSPRQRLSDRIKQFETFAGRGTVHQGQGTVLFKYVVPIDSNFDHTNPPPFYTEPLGSTITTENAPDFIPQSIDEINSTHRVGFLRNGEFIPAQEEEWWWNGEYNVDFRDRGIYGTKDQTALDNPKYPIVRDGNLKFSVLFPEGISTTYNWGLRFDTWFKISDLGNDQTYLRWVAQVNGHIRIDYFDRTGYNSEGEIQGSWKTALDTTDSETYYSQLEKEEPTESIIGCRQYYIQGGPSVPLGGGNGTLPTPRLVSEGGAWDLSATFVGREGEERSKFVDEYVPVVIRFWYGKPNPQQSNPILSGPVGPASLALNIINSNIVEQDLPKWNDYSAEVKVTYNNSTGAWEADSPEENFANFTEIFEIVAHSLLDSAQPLLISDYIPTPEGSPIIATKLPPDGNSVTRAQFSIQGISPQDNSGLWVVAKNRPWKILPSGNNRREESLWQRYLFYPSPFGGYKTSDDLLDGVGNNYVEPNPIFNSFELNPAYYQAKYGQLPLLNTYGPTRYDGLLPNTITESVSTQRDYDYSHDKLLLIGRQKKDETIAPLATGETREKAENYTFIEVNQNEAGRGGNVIITAYPANNLSVLSTSVDNAQFGKFLHMEDNSKTFAYPSRQGITSLVPEFLPLDANFPGTHRVRYEEINGTSGRLVYGTWNGSNFSPDTTGVIAKLSLGTENDERDHSTKSAFLTDFKTVSGEQYSFYGMIGLVRESKSSETIEVDPDGVITSGALFPNGGAETNNEQYYGTEIIFENDSNGPYRVISYSASEQKVTISPAKPAGTYENCQIWYNHFSMSGTLPAKIINSSTSSEVSRTPSILPSGSFSQISFVFNTAYQYSRADNGAGLSFGETLYVKQGSSPTPSAPFSIDTELPNPPADIVIPFGYDNSASSSDPGLGGLCYPPYTVQKIELQSFLSIGDSDLYSKPEGQYDMWWGAREDFSNLGGKSLTITSKLLFDFSQSDRAGLLSTLSTDSQKRTFNGSEYSHKLEVELNVELPSRPIENNYIFNDVKVYSNNKPVKDRYYIFINNNESQLEVLSPNDPNWQ